MLKGHEFSQVIQSWFLSEKAQAEIKHIRSLELFRRMESARGNESGVYPSRKMKRLIQLESLKIEFAGIHQFEQVGDTLEDCDRPP